MAIFTGDNGDNVLAGGTGDDTLNGLGGNDTLIGDAGADTLDGGDGNDILDGGLGTDTYIGGAGFDTVTYANSAIAVVMDNLTGTVMAGTGGGSEYLSNSIERVIGSIFDDFLAATGGALVTLEGGPGNDTLSGDEQDDFLYGGDGNDLMLERYFPGVHMSNDSYDGGNGIDTVSYGIASAAVNIDLRLTTAQNTGGDGIDTIVNVENINGTGFNDTLIGNSVGNALNGGPGNDTFTGGAGADTLTGGAGVDIFRDTVAGFNGDTITDLAIGETIVLTDANPATFTASISGNTLTFSGGSLTLSAVPAGHLIIAADPFSGVTLSFSSPPPPTNDFNGDGRSDILWRDSSGQFGDWLSAANGSASYNSAAGLTTVGNDWHIAGTGDFNGDGRVDILWRNDNGAVGNWLANAGGGFAYNSAAGVIGVGNDWHIAGTGDFNGDGRDDILWRNDNGQVGDWLATSNGGFASNSASVAGVGNDWHIAGTGDFNGDGRDDILWRNDDGSFGDWLGQANGGFVYNAAAGVVAAPTYWHIVGTGDFNGDGRDDILWRANDGQFGDWLGQANGGFAYNSVAGLTPINTDWHVAATGDYNGDGRDDILWRNDSGALANWLAGASGGFAFNSAAGITQVPTSWHVEPLALLV